MPAPRIVRLDRTTRTHVPARNALAASCRRAIAAARLALALTASGCAPAEYVVTEDLRYDATIGFDGAFDLYEPTSDGTRAHRPAVLAIHGGAWRGGDKAWGADVAKELC